MFEFYQTFFHADHSHKLSFVSCVHATVVKTIIGVEIFMNIGDISSILLCHSSSSPLFSNNDFSIPSHSSFLQTNENMGMMEYFDSSCAHTMSSIFKMNSEYGDNHTECIYNPNEPVNSLGIYRLSAHPREPLREIDPNAETPKQENKGCSRCKSEQESIISPPLTSASSFCLSEKSVSSSLASSSLMEPSLFFSSEKPAFCAADNSASIPNLKKNPRFTGSDLYKPSFIRGSGSEREGRCEFCDPKIWLNLKRSTYWYHMNFTHGISSKTGLPYPDPLYIRALPLKLLSPSSSLDGIEKRQFLEAFCGNCKTWIAITIPALKMTDQYPLTPPVYSYDRSKFSDWFKHCQKCLH